VKLARLLLMVALFGISCSVARADGTDPKVFTQGCGGTGQPACDAFYVTPPGSTPETGVSGPLGELNGVIFSFLAADDPSNPYGVTAAFLDVVNISGFSVGSFVFNLASEDSSGETLSYSCGSAPEGSSGSLPTCTQLGTDSFQFSGAQICSVPPGPPIGEAQFLIEPTCQYGERFVLAATDGDPTDLAGQSVAATFYAPEPSSGLLLLVGLAGGFFLRKRSFSLA
jgi:hypothetical protein